MSGGTFNYTDSNLKSEMFGWWSSNEKWNSRDVLEDRELSEMTFDLLTILHDFDYYKAGDSGEERWLKAKTEFKNKWLKNPKVRVQRVIDTAVEDLRQELYKTYSLEDKTNEG